MQLSKTWKVNASAGDTWSLLAEGFGDVGLWTSGIDSSQLSDVLGKGAIRTCGLPDGSWIKESVTGYDPDAMTFSYTVVQGAPRWIKEASNIWQIRAISGNQCEVTSNAVIVLPWWLRPLTPMMRIMVGRMGEQFVREAEYYLTHERIHPRATRAKNRAAKRMKARL